jgi:hypothetical protein
MEQSTSDLKEVEQNLYDSFISFLDFSFELINSLNENKNNYKFAVVNIQISLELFLKYYFIRKGFSQYVIDNIKSNGVRFKDFSTVLNNYFSVKRWTYGRKRELIKILETRNSIVHSGTNTQWNKDVAGYIIKCIFFMHGILKSEFGELLISNKNIKLINNKLWTESVKDFIDNCLIDCDVRTCLSCGEYTLIPKEVFDIGEPTSSVSDDLVCLNCLEVYEMESDNTIIECYKCSEESYFVHLLNPQNKQLYEGKCSECGTNTWVRKCAECEKLYHPSEVHEQYFDDKYFCSDECVECYKEA